jgi:hypothetical protein
MAVPITIRNRGLPLHVHEYYEFKRLLTCKLDLVRQHLGEFFL